MRRFRTSIHRKEHRVMRAFLASRAAWSRLSLMFLTLLLLGTCPGRAQNYLTSSGTPNFAAPEPVELGFTDASNGVLHLEIPLGSFPQRGSNLPLTFKLIYDSAIWQTYGGGGSADWAPGGGIGGFGTYGWVQSPMGMGYVGESYDGYGCYVNWEWTDLVGTQHFFPIRVGTSSPCPQYPQSAFASDSSGFWMNVTSTGAWVYAPDGTLMYQPEGQPGYEDASGNIVLTKDSNGNYLSSPFQVSTIYIDTLGRNPIQGGTVSGGCANGTTCMYVANSQGGTSEYVIQWATIYLNTAFGQSSVTECTSSNGGGCNMTVIQSITLPDNTSYTFQYDCNPSATGNTSQICLANPNGGSGSYGLMTRMTLPTGGQVTYSYEVYSDSYGNKSDWLVGRTSAYGSWGYWPAVISTCKSGSVGCQQQVTVYKPSGNRTAYTFTLNNGAWPVEVQNYSAGGELLSTVNNTYDFSQSCPLYQCTGAGYIRMTDTTTTMYPQSGAMTKKTHLDYVSVQNGLVADMKEWKYYSGTAPSFPSVPDRATYTTYLTTGTNDINKPTSVTVCNNSGSSSACTGGGSQVSQTLYTYDSYSASCPGGGLQSVTGTSNHDDTNFGSGYTTRGNATLVQSWVSGSTYLSKQLCYDSTGQVTQETDPNGNITSYSHADNFYYDNGSNPPPSYTAPKPTNAYVTKITQGSLAATFGYYFGSGKAAFATDPNGITSYSHFMDPFDRSTQDNYALVGWDQTVYSSETQGEVYTGIGSVTPSTGCSSCQNRQVVLDSYGRRVSEKLLNNANNDSLISEVDTTYDASGRVATVSHPYGPSGQSNLFETYGYDGLDRVSSVTHPDGQTVTTLYGDDSLGSQQSSSVYGLGYPVISEDETGRAKQEWIDGFGRVIEVDTPTSSGSAGTASLTINVFDPSVLYNTCPNWGYCPVTEYNAGTFSVTVGGFTSSTYYSNYSTTAQSLASSLAAGFNVTGSPVSATASGSTLTVTALTPGANSDYSFSISVTYNYQSYCGNSPCFYNPGFWATPSSGSLSGGSSGTMASTFYTYDVLGHLTSVAQGVQTRTFAYDGLGRAISITTPEAGTETLAYTSGGALCSGDPSSVCQRTDARGVVTNYYYDHLNRLVGRSYVIPGGSNVSPMPNVCTTSMGQSANTCYTYDVGGAQYYALGRRTQMTDPSGSESYQYDAAGRITQLTKVIGTTSYPIIYAYNAADEITQVTYPSGRVVQLSYNSTLGQVCEIAPSTSGCGTAASPYATGYSYNSAGQLTNFNYGNGVAAAYTYSTNRSQLASLAFTSGGNTLFGLNYSYQQNSGNNCNSNVAGDNGQIQCIEDVSSTSITPGANGRSVSYTYDALGRLNSSLTVGTSQFPQWGLSEAFDQYGNRLSQTVTAGSGPPSSLSFSTQGGARTNQPDGWCFDPSGNLLSKTSSTCPPGYPTFVYDGEDQLTSAPSAGVSYLYDGSGTRVERCLPNCTSPTSWTVYIYSGGADIAEYNNGAAVGSPSQEFIYSAAAPGSGLLASVTGGSTLTYFHSDHLGWRVSTNTSGQIVGQQGSYPYGENWYSQNGNEFMFTSYQYDTQSALYYAMARWYDASAGRFCSADPVGGNPEDPQSWNRYPYSRNDPINITDPSGQHGFWYWLAKIFEIAAAVVLTVEAGIDISSFFTGADAAPGVLTDIAGDLSAGALVANTASESQVGRTIPTTQPPQISNRPPFPLCDPKVWDAMKLAYETAQMKTLQNKANQQPEDAAHTMEGGFPVYDSGTGAAIVGNDGPNAPVDQEIQYGPENGWSINQRSNSTVDFHTHPLNSSGLPSTPSNHLGETGDDTTAAQRLNKDQYVISSGGLSVVHPNGDAGWIIQGLGIDDWLKKLKTQCTK